jgi:hypothetical protein
MTSEISAGAGNEAVKAPLIFSNFHAKITEGWGASQMFHKNFLIN